MPAAYALGIISGKNTLSFVDRENLWIFPVDFFTRGNNAGNELPQSPAATAPSEMGPLAKPGTFSSMPMAPSQRELSKPSGFD